MEGYRGELWPRGILWYNSSTAAVAALCSEFAAGSQQFTLRSLGQSQGGRHTRRSALFFCLQTNLLSRHSPFMHLDCATWPGGLCGCACSFEYSSGTGSSIARDAARQSGFGKTNFAVYIRHTEYTISHQRIFSMRPKANAKAQPYPDLAAVLKEIRGDRPISQMARHCGIGTATWHALEQGKSWPRQQAVHRIVAQRGQPLRQRLS